MANMVLPNEGKLLWLEWALTGDGSSYEDFTVDLFQNNETVADDSTLTDFTIATFPGYATVDLARADFDSPAIVGDVAESTASPTPTFSCTGGGGQLCYGWIMVGVDSGKVLAGQNFDSPRNMVDGSTESLDPFAIDLQSI